MGGTEVCGPEDDAKPNQSNTCVRQMWFSRDCSLDIVLIADSGKKPFCGQYNY
jgi:hypothetical protein